MWIFPQNKKAAINDQGKGNDAQNFQTYTAKHVHLKLKKKQ